MIKDSSAVIIKEFVKKLLDSSGEYPSPVNCLEYGLQRGWLEAQDTANPEQNVLRKHAARMIHNFLRLELKEADEIDTAPAYVLQDLFDCHVCAGHIMQVYVKGIMDGVVLPDERLIFAAEKVISEEEAEKIINRIFQKKARIPRYLKVEKKCSKGEPEEVSLEQALQILRENKKTLLVDVRTEREYAEEHLNSAIHAPLLALIKNPFMFSESRDKIILLYCKEGHQSKAAAQCLAEAGYKNVAFFAWKGEK